MTAISYPDLAGRNEYHDHRLEQAACLVWLRVAPLEGLRPPADWLANEVQNLRELLADDGRVYPNDDLRRYALGMAEVTRPWQSSSARVEAAVR